MVTIYNKTITMDVIVDGNDNDNGPIYATVNQQTETEITDLVYVTTTLMSVNITTGFVKGSGAGDTAVVANFGPEAVFQEGPDVPLGTGDIASDRTYANGESMPPSEFIDGFARPGEYLEGVEDTISGGLKVEGEQYDISLDGDFNNEKVGEVTVQIIGRIP